MVESLFVAFRLTGDEQFRKHGWDIFQAIQAHCRVETGGYTGVLNVEAFPAVQLDEMETFFLVRQSLISTSTGLVGDRGVERNPQISLFVVLGSGHVAARR